MDVDRCNAGTLGFAVGAAVPAAVDLLFDGPGAFFDLCTPKSISLSSSSNEITDAVL
jgi:hypothetical protein